MNPQSPKTMATSVAPESAATGTASQPAGESTPPPTTAASAAPTTTLTAEPTSVVPEKYEFKYADGVKDLLDPALAERIAATARERGLSSEAGQQLFDDVTTPLVAAHKATQKAQADAAKAIEEANKPGGTAWTERVTGWDNAVKTDPKLGGANYAKTVERAQQGLRLVNDPQLNAMLHESGLGSHPAAVRLFAWIGNRAAEPQDVVRGGITPERKSTAEVLYDHPTSKVGSAA